MAQKDGNIVEDKSGDKPDTGAGEGQKEETKQEAKEETIAKDDGVNAEAERVKSYHQAKLKDYISREDIQEKVAEIGAAITRDFAGESVKVIGALKGSFIFMADLVRAIDLPLDVDFIEVSSYGDSKESSGTVKINKDFSSPLRGHNVIVVEDIIDTGITLNFLIDIFQLREPKSIRIAALLVKEEKQQLKHRIDYRGFNIPDDFVIGYGMDYAGFFRNLPDIKVMEED